MWAPPPSPATSIALFFCESRSDRFGEANALQHGDRVLTITVGWLSGLGDNQ